MRDSLVARVHECALQAEGGDFRRLPPLLVQLREQFDVNGDLELRAHAQRLEGLQQLAGVLETEPISPEEFQVYRTASRSARRAASLALVPLERMSVLQFDGAVLQRLVEVHRSLLEGIEHAPEERVHLETAGHWAAFYAGTPAHETELRTLERRCAELAMASLVIELACLRALTAMGEQDLERAVEQARRASRMARTESKPQSEYLANVVLARLRRMSERPHLATRILGALRATAPPAWHAWIDWERFFAGVLEPNYDVPTGQLNALLDAARQGHRERFDTLQESLLRACVHCAFAQDDVCALLIGIDPGFEPRAFSEALRSQQDAWRAGISEMPPFGIRSACARHRVTSDDAIAFVHADASKHRAVRLLSPGLGLVDESVPRLPQRPRRRGRAETASAALLLAGPQGLEDAALFETVYGFAYRPETHEGTFSVMLHRMTKWLGDHATLQRSQGRVALDCQREVIVPDPRCAQNDEDRIAAAMAHAGPMRAGDIAQQVELPLRTVQRALSRLSSEGECTVERSGRVVRYHVEDTTFSEPTLF